MFKKTAWRNTASIAVSVHQDQALSTTIFLLKSYGPTGFLLREDGEIRNLKHGLVERQILELLNGLHQAKAHKTENDVSSASGTSSQTVTSQKDGSVCRRIIQAQDVCPICQEELLEKKMPVSYCRFGCGNNVHISCMKVWADYQKLSDSESIVKCPLCRENFSSLKLLQVQVKNAAKLFTAAEREKPDRHLGVVCQSCQVCPVIGKCFKCTVCSYFYLCADCSQKSCHPQHRFALRTVSYIDSAVNNTLPANLQPEATSISCVPLIESITTKIAKTFPIVCAEMHCKFLNENCRCFCFINPVAEDPLPENVLRCLPTVRVRSGSQLLDDGQQCRICLQNFCLGQQIRILPCHHKFHMDCVDGSLCQLNVCPLDGYVIYNPLTWTTSERKLSPKSASCLSSDCAKQPENNLKDLFIPGVALQAKNPKTAPSHGSLNLEVLTSSSETLTIPQKVLTNQFHGLCVTKTNAVTKDGKAVLQKKRNRVFPESSSINHSPKCDAADRQNACSSKNLAAACASATPNMFVPVTQTDQPQGNLSVGSGRPEPDNRGRTSSTRRRTGVQPRTRSTPSTQVRKNKPTSELRMTGVPINTQL
ncbi:E3 ubiquitin-protein ligase ZSWIM2 [Channa argus]|uniref:E3 ubiquitin-protein ligase ZSWIM2 n=1 Tax=Channa argus TaxID=215402 RepID=A0A6G1PDN3_CHAAH|nr:E3 ubiquitin-protein ligase ZSWIM2 [Channa argus]